ncbi:pentapeptide repeat-containing protein [Calothrix sp. FACHB-1219]|uniref:nSTAND1 domain-containing NTPase n=1 Tax=unclassified Calothrix TaxID=2619626 RepID=UPI00168640B2|nr:MULTISPECIES: pentapeptide repeat-containing protein [unclassified Calothrix]MBD2207612.1 pentapeptide repeat-containing protein [Calothrix sp. FACHB-168]MBD2222213.1 pentapeptide repeat-containing protein [Calothrix sp. FACHB-1219]
MIKDALVVGINTYSYERLPNLTAPAQDAEAIAKLLERYGQFNVRRLPSVKDKENNTVRVGQKTSVTLTQLEDAIVQLFKPEGKNVPDTALLYFSGHGLRKNRGIQQGFLATSDVNPDFGNWGLSLQWLRQLLQDSEVKQQIIWLDCCYSGELLNFAEADPGDRGKGRDRCFIAASRDFEVAYEAIGSRHSVLTEALLQGLDPQQSPGQWVTNYTLIDFLHHHWANYPQRPLFANSGSAIDLTRIWEVQKQESSYAVTGSVCPYRGLQYFDCKQEDAEYFFGREALTDQLLEKVRSGNFLAILGASGSGKSSVVRAGLLYQIQLGRRLSGSENWSIKIFRPGEHPLQSLALAFLDSGLSVIDRASQLAKAEELLAKGGVGLGQLINAADTERVVLLADQFEEAFSLCQDIEERQRFFECLLSALHHTNNKLCLVLTMRADFFGKCAEQEYSGLAQQIQQHLVTVTPMRRDELEQAITAPAVKVGLQVQKELVQQIIADVEGSPGSLPLLQYTLTELWQQQEFTYAAYTRLGGIKGTLEKRATEVYESLSPEEQPVAKRIFLELTQLGEGIEDTRRRVLLQNLVSSPQEEELVERVIGKLAAENVRLVVTSTLVEKGAESGRLAVVDVAHEALIRYWSLLRKWIDENRDNLRQKRKIEVAAEEWRNQEKAKDYLLQGKPLQDALIFQSAQLGNLELSYLAKEFIQRSLKYRQNRRIKSIGLGLIIPLNLAIFLGVFVARELLIQQRWQIIYAAKGKELSQQRNQALQELVKFRASLTKINLRDADLRGIDIRDADLSGADLSGADLSGSKLNRVNFSGAIMSKTNLWAADLRNANFGGAILNDVKFNNANLSGTNFKNAQLSAVELNSEYLDSALQCSTTMFDGKVSNRDCVNLTISSSANTDIQSLTNSPTFIPAQKGGKLQGNLPITLAQALDLTRRKNQGLSPAMQLQITLDYYDLQKTDEQVRTTQSAVTNAQASLRDAEAQERAGAGTRFDVLQAQLNLGIAQEGLTNAVLRRKIARRRLSLRLGFPESVSVSVADPVKLNGLWNLTLEKTIALALQNRSKQQQNQIRLEVEQLYISLESSLESIQITNVALERARETLRLARLRFQAGVGTQTDVIQAENTLTISENNRVQSIVNYNQSLASLIRAISSDNENTSNRGGGILTPPIQPGEPSSLTEPISIPKLMPLTPP